MLKGCYFLKSLESLNNWDKKKVINMSYLFSDYYLIRSLEGISNWKVDNAFNMKSMF